jgi:hypothetical protein
MALLFTLQSNDFKIPAGMSVVKSFLNIMAIGCLLLSQCATPASRPSPRTVQRAIYHWKSTYAISAFEQRKLDSLHIGYYYTRFFDVDYDPLTGEVAPKAIIRFVQRPRDTLVPVVFITNESLQHIDSAQTSWLAQKIGNLIRAIIARDSLPTPSALQIDCDWTAGTRNRYFAVLRQLRQSFPQVLLSATIRLYQTRYKEKAGIPPVDRGLLMCYNMGNLKNLQSGNSILDIAELEKYIGNLQDYPLPLDVALPIFDWKVWFRGGQYRGISSALPDSCLHTPVFVQKGVYYTAQTDTVMAGYGFLKGDVLRHEQSEATVVQEAVRKISARLKNTPTRVSLYHLDSLLLTKYTAHEMANWFDGFE